jgi:hypothetical protein
LQSSLDLLRYHRDQFLLLFHLKKLLFSLRVIFIDCLVAMTIHWLVSAVIELGHLIPVLITPTMKLRFPDAFHSRLEI